MHCNKYLKTKNPKCNEQENCLWIPKKDNIMGHCSPVKKVKTDSSVSCKKLKKTKSPICEEQSGCVWKPKQGTVLGHCANITNTTKPKPISKPKPKPKDPVIDISEDSDTCVEKFTEKSVFKSIFLFKLKL